MADFYMSEIANFTTKFKMAFEFGDFEELPVGDLLAIHLEKEGPKEKTKSKKSRKKPKPIIVAYEDPDDDAITREFADYYCRGRRTNDLDVIENSIPEELKSIGAARFNNLTLEDSYKEEFGDDVSDGEAKVECIPDTSPTPPDEPRKKQTKKNRKSYNALLNSLERKKQECSETSDQKSDISISLPKGNEISSSSISSEDFCSVTDESLYTTAPNTDLSSDSSNRTPKVSKKKHHSTSKRLASSGMIPKKTSKRATFVPLPASYSDDFQFKASDFPPISSKF